MITRRSLLRGVVAAPAVVSASSIMPVRLWKPELPRYRVIGTIDRNTGGWVFTASDFLYELRFTLEEIRVGPAIGDIVTLPACFAA